MDLGFDGAAAVVVGGSKGMGMATARCLAADGARVAVLGRTPADVTRAAEELAAAGSPDTLALTADACDVDAVAAAFDAVGQRWGALNVLVNVVGPYGQGSFETVTDADWREAVDQGALSMVHCVQAALPLLRRAEWARIVNFSAHSTQRQSVHLVAYTAAKAMVTSISKNLSLLLAPEEIPVNVVSPGTFVTPGLRDWARSKGIESADPYQLMSAIGEHFGHPAQMPRAGLPEEAGAVAAFLASRRNSYMTGANVNVDGGSDFT